MFALKHLYWQDYSLYVKWLSCVNQTLGSPAFTPPPQATETIYCLSQTNYNMQLIFLQAIQSQSVSTNGQVSTWLEKHISISIGLIILNHPQFPEAVGNGHMQAYAEEQGQRAEGDIWVDIRQ